MDVKLTRSATQVAEKQQADRDSRTSCPTQPVGLDFTRLRMYEAFRRAEKAAGLAEFLRSAEQKGSPDLDDLFRHIESDFNSFAEPLLFFVDGMDSAERVAFALDEASKLYFEDFERRYEGVAEAFETDVPNILRNSKVRVWRRIAELKEEAFERVLQGVAENNESVDVGSHDPSCGLSQLENGVEGSEALVARVAQSEPSQSVNHTRRRIEAFIEKLRDAGHPISKTDIWRVAGYSEATEFQRFQREAKRVTPGSAAKFNHTLNMSSESFVEKLEKLRLR